MVAELFLDFQTSYDTAKMEETRHILFTGLLNVIDIKCCWLLLFGQFFYFEILFRTIVILGWTIFKAGKIWTCWAKRNVKFTSLRLGDRNAAKTPNVEIFSQVYLPNLF